MNDTRALTEHHCEPELVELRIKGHIDARWADWFGGLSIALKDNGTTLLTGKVVDQSALYGLLRKVRDLGMVLISINCVSRDQAAAPLVSVGENSD